MFKFLWTYFKTYKKIFLAVILCSILISVADLLTPYLTAKFIDEILTAGNVENFGNFFLRKNNFSYAKNIFIDF